MLGLIGKTLSHSFSKEIHETISSINYRLIELDELDSFFANKDFKGVNVTIPYKHDVISFCDELSEVAKEIGVVNTIINSGGYLKGYNTDYHGLKQTLVSNNISLKNKNIVILGNGSTSKTIEYLCRRENTSDIYILARHPKPDQFNFHVFDSLKSVDVIFNATPVGMYPDNDDSPLISLTNNKHPEAVIDVVYNPLKTRLLLDAEEQGIKSINGLTMLINQAIKANELFTGITHKPSLAKDLYTSLTKKLTNLVFIGMPMSGKSFYGNETAKIYHKKWIEIDDLIEEKTKTSIPGIFRTWGEKEFRKMESQMISKYSKYTQQAISCGGGVILNPTNIQRLKQNGVIIFLDVPLSLLKKSYPKDRPLLKNKENLTKLYNNRYQLYKQYSDIHIHKDSYDESVILERIKVKINAYFSA